MGASRQTMNQALSCIPVVTSTFIIGLGWGWAGSVLAKLQKSPSPEFTVTADEVSWIASINEMGRLFSPFVTPLLVDNIGRKYALILVSILLLLVWTGLIFTTNFYLLCALRVTFGIANGIIDVTGAIYTTENCSASFRGIIGGVIQVVYNAGVLTQFILSSYLSYTHVAIVNSAMALASLATVYLYTETPYFLIMKGKLDEAEKSLVWLLGARSLNTKVSNELKKMRQNIEGEQMKKKSFFSLFTSSTNVKCIGIVLGIFLLSTATGNAAILTYASMIFVETDKISSSDFTIFYGIAQFAAVCVSPFIVEKINRRTLLIGCFVGFIFANSCTYLLLSLHSNGYEIMNYPWLIFSSVTVYVSLYAIMSSGTYLVRGELLPLSVRAIGGSIAIILQSFTSFSITKMFSPITQSFGMKANFVGYITSATFVAIFTYFMLPETRGKSLDEIQKSFSKKTDKQNMYVEGKCDENTCVSKEFGSL